MVEKPPSRVLPLDWARHARHDDFQLSPSHLLLVWSQGLRPGPTELHLDAHAGLEAGVVLHGEEECVFRDTSFTVGPGDMWLVSTWEPHATRVVTPEVETLALMFLPEFLGEAYLADLPWLALFAVPANQRPRVSDELTRRYVLRVATDLKAEVNERALGWESAASFHLLLLLLALRRTWCPPANLTPEAASLTNLTRIRPVLDALHARPSRYLTLLEAARLAGLGKTRFCHVFRLAMGVSYGEYLLRTRLLEAAHLLTTTDFVIADIASRAGFSDGSHLHHRFFQHYRCTPGEYRRRFRE